MLILKLSGSHGSELSEQERAQSSVPAQKLSEFRFFKVPERQERLLGVLKAEKVFNKSQDYFNDREAKLETALGCANLLFSTAGSETSI